jgi:hypothetical protein
MRMVVIGLIVLAGLKVWTQDRVYRSAMDDALIDAYRQRAVEICRKQSESAGRDAIAATTLWGTGSKAEVLIGNPNVDVAMWDTQNPRWSERFQHPNLILMSTDESRARCAYDLRDGVATVSMR